jgi:hypothetical protein
MLGLVVSESTARRTLREYGYDVAVILGRDDQYYKVLEGWDGMSEFNRGMVYSVMSERVSKMHKEGRGVWL